NARGGTRLKICELCLVLSAACSVLRCLVPGALCWVQRTKHPAPSTPHRLPWFTSGVKLGSLLEKLHINDVNPGACVGPDGWITDPAGERRASINPATA